MTHDRLVALEGVRNFRDFGGYDTRDGAVVRRGALFRSAHFAEATEPDLSQLNALGLAMLVDLRRPDERAAQPNRWPGEGAVQVVASDLGQESAPPHLAFLQQDDLTPDAVRGYMLATYRAIPYERRYQDLFTAFLQGLADGAPAGVVHCAAGKDRTGIICALTLMALDVPEEAVFADYEFTNTAVDLERRLPEMHGVIEARLNRKVPIDSLRPMLGVHVDYLRAALDEIAARSGDAHAYMRDTLGLTPERRAALQARLTG
jgi:protein-tyrosine phosphatase